ncbi:MAG: tartrate dehydrogenase [Maribacter sp.]
MKPSKKFKIAVIPGDGIGKPVIEQGIMVLERIGDNYGISFDWEFFGWSCQYYSENDIMMPADGLNAISSHDAIYLGAVGFPGVPDHVSLWGLLIPLRRAFQQYACIRPVRLFEGISSPLANVRPEDIDFVIVRENNEGEYSEIGGRIFQGTENEIVSQQTLFSKKGVDRILKYAFEMASKRTGKVTSATKSNGIMHTMPFWDERFALMSKEYPNVITNQFHIDILTAHFVQHPDWFDVVVGSNLFGDILSDLGPAIAGTIGIAASANINPEGNFPSMFEPVHGSAPDITGQGIANPIGAIWAAALMIQHLGYQEAHNDIMDAIERVVRSSNGKTRDMGGNANTKMCADAIISEL